MSRDFNAMLMKKKVSSISVKCATRLYKLQSSYSDLTKPNGAAFNLLDQIYMKQDHEV